jgi:hypothetical protein
LLLGTRDENLFAFQGHFSQNNLRTNANWKYF